MDTFLLSCRAMGRRIEQRMLTRLAEAAQVHGVEFISLCYYATSKNQPVLDFLRSTNQAPETPIQNGFQFRFPATWGNKLLNNSNTTKNGE